MTTESCVLNLLLHGKQNLENSLLLIREECPGPFGTPHFFLVSIAKTGDRRPPSLHPKPDQPRSASFEACSLESLDTNIDVILPFSLDMIDLVRKYLLLGCCLSWILRI